MRAQTTGERTMYTNAEIKSAPGFNRTKEQRAKHNIHHAANWIIGGYENAMSDYPKTSEDYLAAANVLNNKTALAEEIYAAATTEIYEDGFCGWGGDSVKILKDIRLLGKETLMKLIDKEIASQGY
jgi:hypothetical protein